MYAVRYKVRTKQIYLGTWTFQQILRKAIWVSKEHRLSEPLSHRLAVPEMDTQCVVPLLRRPPEKYTQQFHFHLLPANSAKQVNSQCLGGTLEEVNCYLSVFFV